MGIVDRNAVESDRGATTVVEPNAVLRGGPSHLPEQQRVRYVPRTDENLKLPWRNGYQHFAPTTEHEQRDGTSLKVFVWERATKIAE
ncbi:DUF5988 family protein [Streptomyces sp. NPDC017979]|uniref:DUF5988 family protein n=1 Tax=Streptomyces sp. NPDC017979 TaxID=3365024 RepID=UPI00379A29AB